VFETRNSESYRAARAGLLRDSYERLGHVHVDAIRTMARTGTVEGLQIDGNEKKNFFCESCVVAKQNCPAHPKRKRNPEAGEFVHTDLCDGFETCSLSGALHLVLFKDDGIRQWRSCCTSRRYRRR